MVKKKTIETRTTPYGNLEIAEGMLGADLLRMCFVNGHMQSAMYLEEGRENDLVFPYMQRFSYAFALKPDIRNALLIGGGTFSYPKFFLDSYRRTKLTVVEICQDMIDLAYAYFGLDELDIEQQSNLRIVCDDAFVFLETCDVQYDLIINDAFIGNRMKGRNERDMESVYGHLCHHGVYMENHVAGVRGPFSLSLQRRKSELETWFDDVEMMICDEDIPLWAQQNILLIGKKGGSDGKD
ncbi:MAG: spermidine synthase [Bulleidia sp.]